MDDFADQMCGPVIEDHRLVVNKKGDRRANIRSTIHALLQSCSCVKLLMKVEYPQNPGVSSRV